MGNGYGGGNQKKNKRGGGQLSSDEVEEITEIVRNLLNQYIATESPQTVSLSAATSLTKERKGSVKVLPRIHIEAYRDIDFLSDNMENNIEVLTFMRNNVFGKYQSIFNDLIDTEERAPMNNDLKELFNLNIVQTQRNSYLFSSKKIDKHSLQKAFIKILNEYYKEKYIFY